MTTSASHPKRLVILPALLLATLPACSVLIVFALTLKGESAKRVFDISNYLGLAAQSFWEHRNFAVPMSGHDFAGTVTFYAARMPVPPVLLAVAYALFHDNMALVHAFKTILLLLPLVAAASIAFRHAQSKWLAAILLIIPFLIPNFIVFTTTLQIEEGYYYSFLALAVALLLFAAPQGMSLRANVCFIIALNMLYFSKSSLRIACVFLLLLSCLRIRQWNRRILTAAFVLVPIMLWGAYLQGVSGRFTTGSSLDGFNLHKGNYAEFLDRYPPADNGYIDRWDQTLSPEHFFTHEWSYNDYHAKAAKDFILTQPVRAFRADLVKADVFWLSLRNIGSGHHHDAFTRLDLPNMLAMRAIMLAALALAIYYLRHNSELRIEALVVLVLFAGISFPYIIGFALTRHAAVLIYPAALFLCRALGTTYTTGSP